MRIRGRGGRGGKDKAGKEEGRTGRSHAMTWQRRAGAAARWANGEGQRTSEDVGERKHGPSDRPALKLRRRDGLRWRHERVRSRRRRRIERGRANAGGSGRSARNGFGSADKLARGERDDNMKGEEQGKAGTQLTANTPANSHPRACSRSASFLLAARIGNAHCRVQQDGQASEERGGGGQTNRAGTATCPLPGRVHSV